MLAPLVLVLLAVPALQSSSTPAERFAASNPGAVIDSGLAWDALVARNARAGFAPLSGRNAQLFLASEEGTGAAPEARAAAFAALGIAEMRAERARLEKATAAGTPLERRAATLGVGRLGPGSTPLLLRIAAQAEPLQAECALLALLYSGQPDARAHVEARAAEEPAIAALVAFARDPDSAPESGAGRLWLELRWAAARRFGLIDGRAWRQLLLEQLYEERLFLDRLVYRSAIRLRRPGVHDHYLGALLEDSGEEALRAAASVLPNEIAQMIQHGLWSPSAEQWPILLDEIRERRLESLAEPLLVQALEQPGVGGVAALLLMRAGNSRGRKILEGEMATGGARLRRMTAESLGDSGSATYLGWLAVLREDEDLGVRAAALVAQVQLGNSGARKTLAIFLVNPELAAKEMPLELLIGALARAAENKAISEVLAEALPALEGEVHLRAAAALARVGRPLGIQALREVLRPDQPPRGALGAELVRALGAYPDNSDLQRMIDFFPQENDLEVNTALAEVLLRAGTPVMAQFLRNAM
ncbi:MAG TPA: hypothetical protein VMT18_01235, partial [Planctomycetota bacterium]|nr:hypothetical protein [Planctomycetota bacterium]